ncbi:hypothetical protein H0H81_012058 [Sphagnurus paluster]|uniref:Vacuolar import/degradation Vid27 C-terminal domain-containing protein n=1 Tax=Sphagnurus paluster TaxID=117069 RepID=A0A9P7GL23_9AGAR|nr:hypothetical protein H0H81_012058 [Sphagnurus paluster]
MPAGNDSNRVEGVRKKNDGVKVIKGKVMMYRNGTMILQNRTEPMFLYEMNMETKKVVNKWEFGISISCIAPHHGSGSMVNVTFFGASDKAVFLIDPNYQKIEDIKTFSESQYFSTITTSASNVLAVATQQGEIRLFKSGARKATAHYQTLAGPITDIDITADEEGLVATTKKRLIFIGQPITLKKLDFLELKGQNLEKMGETSFLTARFNRAGTAIVTSTSQFLILWEVNEDRKWSYKFMDCKDYVVGTKFKPYEHGDEDERIGIGVVPSPGPQSGSGPELPYAHRVFKHFAKKLGTPEVRTLGKTSFAGNPIQTNRGQTRDAVSKLSSPTPIAPSVDTSGLNSPRPDRPLLNLLQSRFMRTAPLPPAVVHDDSTSRPLRRPSPFFIRPSLPALAVIYDLNFNVWTLTPVLIRPLVNNYLPSPPFTPYEAWRSCVSTSDHSGKERSDIIDEQI